MTFERVYTVTDYYDGPRGGVADFEGRPHVYEAESEEDGRYAETFRLVPITPEQLALAQEDWAIWSRWYAACDAGSTTVATHPALPEERPRFDEIQRLLAGPLRAPAADAIRARAEFRNVALSGPNPGEVRWERC
jgi:hypothetical protein